MGYDARIITFGTRPMKLVRVPLRRYFCVLGGGGLCRP